MSVHRIAFSEVVRFKAEQGLIRAVAEAARRSRTSSAEFMRCAVRDRVVAAGVRLPPVGPDDGPAAPPSAPALRSAA